MDVTKMLADCLAAAGIPRFGVCAFDERLLLPGARSASRLPPGAKSVVVCLFPYFVGLPKARNLSLYSMLPDYHAVAGGMLHEAARCLSGAFAGRAFVPFVDASPLDEVECGRLAGLGRRGQNGQLIAPGFGSLVFLGELVTDFALPPAEPDGRCEGCGACLSACPTGALRSGGMDVSRCRSALSQKKGTLSDREAEHLARGGMAWGCDVCTLACPHNRAPLVTPIEAFSSDVVPILTHQNLDLLMVNRAFSWRGRAVLLRNLSLLDG